MRKIIVISLILWVFMVASPVYAHASLERSNPAANATLTVPPAEIRLWFTEEPEPEFSSIKLRDANGDEIETPPATIDPDDPFQMVLIPGELANGVYTVSWKVVSKRDGHLTQGSFSFGIGESVGQNLSVSRTDIPVNSALIRWLNLFGMALAVGSVGFVVFVWRDEVITPRMRWLMWAGWIFLGVTTLLILLLQVSTIAEVSLIEVVSSPFLESVLRESYFGELWIIRMILWVCLGAGLFFSVKNPRLYWPVLLIGGGILLTQSLFSHASSAQDKNAAVAADWLHLVGMTLWLGGLIQFLNVLFSSHFIQDAAARTRYIASLQSTDSRSGTQRDTAHLVSQFSSYARVTVMLLMVTGLYAAWLHVGSIDALTETDYGQALLVKLILFVPLLAIAGVNLIFTHRGLKSGNPIWNSRLRGLIGAEIALVVGILIAVGVMTAISPGRDAFAQQQSLPEQPTPLVEKQFKNNLNAELTLSSAWAGANTFSLQLTDREGNPIEDASLIRLRFENQTENTGESELNPTHQGDGLYTASGANLGTPGDWQIRATVQRPNTYDTVIDFHPKITPAPVPPAPVDTAPPVESRQIAMLLSGIGLLLTGGYALGQKPVRLMAVPVLVSAGMILIATGTLSSGQRVEARYEPAPNAPVQVIPAQDFPLLITADGTLLQPDTAGNWQKALPDVPVRDAYFDASNILWAATDDGLYFYQDTRWQKYEATPVTRLSDTHGYLFALGKGEIVRLESGKPDHQMLLDIPLAESPANEMVMLGNHSHVLQNGEDVFLTPDLGLSWFPLDAPEPVQHISIDADGQLLASTPDGLYQWSGGMWRKLLPLPDDHTIEAMQVFNAKLYAVAGGKLYHQRGDEWETVKLPDSDGAYLIDLTFAYPDTLWVLDAEGRRLWSTKEGQDWAGYPIQGKSVPFAQPG